jgi:hypothetical protein
LEQKRGTDFNVWRCLGWIQKSIVEIGRALLRSEEAW